MGFFDDSHVTSVGMRGSLGPSVGLGEMTAQSIKQQFRVDSTLALHNELQNRWLNSLRAANITLPQEDTAIVDPWGVGAVYHGMDPDPGGYIAMSQYVSGQPVDDNYGLRALSNNSTARIKSMIEANEKIKALNNPDIQSFEQILEEVVAMQQETEAETASMYERTGKGGFVASLLGAMVGSFTARDPLNIMTAPIGVGRTIATRIATDMGVAAAVTGYTELAAVAPAREIAGLPERDPLFNIAAATLGAGVIRGGIEGIGYGVSRLRSEPIDFDTRDSILEQMFEANADKPSARAGSAILDDTKFIERNNPYGEGHQANLRFVAELQEVQRAMNGEPMTAVARVLPPIPYEQLKKSADFEIVKEQAPLVYAKMEAAQAKLSQASSIQEFRATVSNDAVSDFVISPANVKSKGEPGFSLDRTYEKDGIITAVFRDENGNAKAGALIPLNDEQKTAYGGIITYVDPAYRRQGIATKLYDLAEEQGLPIKEYSGRGDLTPAGAAFVNAREARRAANAEYQAAYRAVEVEAARIREEQARIESAQRRESVSILMPTAAGRPFIGPMLQHDYAAELVERINKFNDTLDEQAVARFTRETLGEGEDAIDVETWKQEGGIDIGLKDPVDPNFRFETDEGEMTVGAAMRDLQDDIDLDEAMRTCLL